LLNVEVELSFEEELVKHDEVHLSMLLDAELNIGLKVNVRASFTAKRKTWFDDLYNDVELLIVAVPLTDPGVRGREILSVDLDSVGAELLFHVLCAEHILKEVLALEGIHVAVWHTVAHNELRILIICGLKQVVVSVVGEEAVVVLSANVEEEFHIEHMVVNTWVSCHSPVQVVGSFFAKLGESYFFVNYLVVEIVFSPVRKHPVDGIATEQIDSAHRDVFRDVEALLVDVSEVGPICFQL
jgi:hypothetical protein